MSVPRIAPPMSFFRPSRPAAGDRVVTIDLGSLQIELGSLDATLAALAEPRDAAGAGLLAEPRQISVPFDDLALGLFDPLAHRFG